MYTALAVTIIMDDKNQTKIAFCKTGHGISKKINKKLFIVKAVRQIIKLNFVYCIL